MPREKCINSNRELIQHKNAPTPLTKHAYKGDIKGRTTSTKDQKKLKRRQQYWQR